MALLPLIMEIRDATATVTLIGTVSILGSLGAFWKNVSWRECRLLLVGIGIGIPIGVYALSTVSPIAITRTLGVVLIAISAWQWFLPRDRHLLLPQWLGFPIGTLSGLLGGAFNMGGPPILVFLQGRRLKVVALIATLQVISAATMLSLLPDRRKWVGQFQSPDRGRDWDLPHLVGNHPQCPLPETHFPRGPRKSSAGSSLHFGIDLPLVLGSSLIGKFPLRIMKNL